MYVVFRDELENSEEIGRLIEKHTKFKVITDLSKSTKRDDVMSFKLSIPTSKVDIEDDFDWDNEDVVNSYFSYCEELTSEFLDFFPKYTIQASMAYKWDEVDDEIYLVVVISNIDLTYRKLSLDILPRMIKQVD